MPTLLLRLYAITLLFALCSKVVIAHEDDAHSSEDAHAAGVAFGQQQLPAGMILPQAEGPRPWTDKPVLGGVDRFQIAIMTDRTGGHRPGVWMDAVRKINLLQPEFVMSVGDLIEGYTTDRDQLQKEWAEFLGFVDQLEMRFFFVPGNHDVINPTQHELWRQKFGDEWYSFDYRGVHFVCLNSEDTRNQIGDEQLAWLRDDLTQHADARWTLVFVHKPLWTYAERAETSGNEDFTNWKSVEQLLADRPHTVFAGHVHHYVQYERNGGRQYYSLATTGGGSRLRGNEYGEFDHIMWLTMEPTGPRLAVLRLEGILPPGVVTEESAERFREFLQLARIDVAPILIDNDGGFGGGDIHVRLMNGLTETIEIEGRIDGLPLNGLSVSPAAISLTAGPGETVEQDMHIQFSESIDLERLSRTTLTATIQTTGEAPLRAEVVAPVVIDRRHNCPRILSPPTIDGITQPWPEEFYATPESPVLLGDTETWQGAADGSFEFHTSHDDSNLYFAVRVADERLVEGDRIELIFDGRRLERRQRDRRLRRGTCRVSVAPPIDAAVGEKVVSGDGAALDAYARWGGRPEFPVEGARFASHRVEHGYHVECALPKELVTSDQGDEWHSFQLAVVLHDQDEPAGKETRILWRGTPEVDRSNRGYGFFVRPAN